MIQWTEPAEQDLSYIEDFIAQDNPAAAVDVVLTIIETAELLLSEHPHIGKPGRAAGTRELVVSRYPAYFLIYEVTGDRIFILRVLHAARQWPS